MSVSPIEGSGVNDFTYSPRQLREVRHDQAMIGNHAACLGILVTFSVVVILFSTKRQRRSFLLALQVFALALVIITEVLLTVYMFKDIQNIFDNVPLTDPRVIDLNRVGVCIDSLVAWAPWVADSVLIYRVHEIYSRSLQMKCSRRFLPVLPLVVLLLVRAGLLAAAVWQDWQSSSNNWLENDQFLRWIRLRLAEWVLQIVYCSYAFVMIMRQIVRLTRNSNIRRRKGYSSQTRSRLRFLIEAVLMTFFIPLIFQIGTLVTMAIYYRSPDSQVMGVVWNRFVQLNYLLSAIFCVLATSWSTIREGGSTIHSRSTKTFSSEQPMAVLKSRGTKSSDEEHGQVEVQPAQYGNEDNQSTRRASAAQPTLLDNLFSDHNGRAIGGYDDDDEDVEELRTTQFISSQQEDDSPQHPRFTSQSAMVPGGNRNQRSLPPFRLPLSHLLLPHSSR